jgi:hypothetical protein
MEAKNLDVEFGTFPEFTRVFAIPRSTGYLLLRDGKIRSRYVGTRRLIDFNSVRQYLAAAPEEPTEEISGKMKQRAKISAEKRAEEKEKRAAENGKEPF